MDYDVIIVGGGAAGFFAAAELLSRNPLARILILEKTTRLLAKVRISGGGRCNVTNAEFNPFRLADHYPRGRKQLKELFKIFNSQDAVNWFESRGVRLKTEEDNRMFPLVDHSGAIIDCLLNETRPAKIMTRQTVISLQVTQGNVQVKTQEGETFSARFVLYCAGGSSKSSAYEPVSQLGVQIRQPIPSLFTFNIPESSLKDLMGLSVSNGTIRIAGTKLSQAGPILVTHWGLSGPAVIRLSAWAADLLASVNYHFKAQLNWVSESEDTVRAWLQERKRDSPKRKIKNDSPSSIPNRLWSRFCEMAGLKEDQSWGEITNRSLNKLVEHVINFQVEVRGKTTFKEEFVTCGGVELSEIDLATMQSKKYSNLLFAGEVLDIDGETGGFNFQAAWTTAYIAATTLANHIKK